MSAASRSTGNVAELRRMFSNFDSTVIESVLAANNGQVDVTIDHLLTMSIDAENENNIQQSIPTTPLRQLPAVIPNWYEDDPPPYPGHERSVHGRTTTMPRLPQRSSDSFQPSVTYNRSQPTANNQNTPPQITAHRDIQTRRWKTAYGQNRICYTGDLPDDFLRIQGGNQSKSNRKQSTNGDEASRYLEDERLALLVQNEEFLHELRRNKDFLNTLQTDQPARPTPSVPSRTPTAQRRSSHHHVSGLSTKPLPLPTPPSVEMPKTPKVRARMLQNVLTQIEQGQSMKTSMVPQESVTQNDGYSYGKDSHDPIPIPQAPHVADFDPLRPESNDEFVARLKNMGKNSKEKFNQLARRFSMRKDSTTHTSKYSKQPMLLPSSERQRLTNELDSDDDLSPLNGNNSNRYLTSV